MSTAGLRPDAHDVAVRGRRAGVDTPSVSPLP